MQDGLRSRSDFFSDPCVLRFNMNSLGLLFVIGAVIAWTIGDFSIQKGTRKFGDVATLGLIGSVGLVGLLPFVFREIPEVLRNSDQLLLFILLSVVTLFSALFLFEGLKRGKLAIIEPVFGIELPFTVLFSIVLGHENLQWFLYALMGVVFIGFLLTITSDISHLKFHRTFFEKGVVFAGIGSIGMGLINFLTGVGSQTISPLMTVWFMHSFLAIACFGYLIARGEFSGFLRMFKKHNAPALGLALGDNLAWIFYAMSMALIPISIATTISESYIVLNVLLGLFVNKEKIRAHQFMGIAIVICGVFAISWIAGS